jgi:hypothetical protein
MQEMFSRGWNELIARDSGPLHVRLILQPVVATIVAIRSGLKDAREGRPVFFWAGVRGSTPSRALVRESWNDVGRLFFLAMALDVAYQVIVLRWWYPVQTLIVATVLAIAPYLAVRGLTNRAASRLAPRPAGGREGVSRYGPRDGSEGGPGA